jgi:Zn ribbon nucleic-acid-binding protein
VFDFLKKKLETLLEKEYNLVECVRCGKLTTHEDKDCLVCEGGVKEVIVNADNDN